MKLCRTWPNCIVEKQANVLFRKVHFNMVFLKKICLRPGWVNTHTGFLGHWCKPMQPKLTHYVLHCITSQTHLITVLRSFHIMHQWNNDGFMLTACMHLLLSGSKKINAEIHVSWQRFSNMTSDWLAAVLPAYQKPGLKIPLTNIAITIEFS